MFNMRDSVLRYYKPDAWEDADYDSHRYHLFELQPGDAEYEQEVNAFINGSPRIYIKTLHRVQNPFQLGSFTICQAQKQFRNETVEVVKYYHPIHGADKEVALEHNMDVRRYSYRYPGHHCGAKKNPKFYKTPGSACNAIPDIPEKVIIVCNLTGKSSDPSTTYKTNQAEYMPIYVATLL